MFVPGPRSDINNEPWSVHVIVKEEHLSIYIKRLHLGVHRRHGLVNVNLKIAS